MNWIRTLLWINFLGSIGAIIVYAVTRNMLSYREDFLLFAGLFAAVSGVGLLLERSIER
ncbi:hypothetical protein [Alkalicoccus urumqiensis]|nr:hypothetical protein [Alkalicoccus urumqiensis]